MSLVGDSQALARAIKAANGGVEVNGDIPDQAHHLLSSNVVVEMDGKYEFLPAGKTNLPQKLADAAGYQLNEAPNGILLPYHFGHQMKLHLQRHCGDHYEKYYDRLRTVLEPTYQKYSTIDVCGTAATKHFLQELKDAEKFVKSNIDCDPPKWWLYDWSQPLWDNDYRDEGTGNLYLNRDPDISYKSGLAWVTEKAGEIRRRYKKKRGKANAYEVKRAWYKKHTYPVPTALY